MCEFQKFEMFLIISDHALLTYKMKIWCSGPCLDLPCLIYKFSHDHYILLNIR